MTKGAAQAYLLELNSKMATNSFLSPKVILFKEYLYTHVLEETKKAAALQVRKTLFGKNKKSKASHQKA